MFTTLMLWMTMSAQTSVVSEKTTPHHIIAGGKGQATLLHNTQTGSDVALSILVLQQGASVPEHKHETSGELLYILEGEVETMVVGKVYRAAVGDAVFIPKDQLHSAKVTKGPVRAVQIYSPAGPEQRFVQNSQVGLPTTK